LLILISFLALTDIYVEMYVTNQHAHTHAARTDDSFACPVVYGRSPSRCSSLRVCWAIYISTITSVCRSVQ
jgi:hypothetical protein